MSELHCYTYAERPDLIEAAENLVGQVWPEFMLNDPVANRYWARLESEFAEFQFVLCTPADEVQAVGSTIPALWDGTPAGLPAGWDAVLEQGFTLPGGFNVLSALSASVATGAQGQGLSRQVVQQMRRLAQQRGLRALIAPVRPSLKSRYPLTPIERYVEWRHPAEPQAPFDPWLRTHWRLGAKIVQIAPRSMLISGTLNDWQTWTGMHFPDSGRYIVPGALEPLEVDLADDQGLYTEPNVWMVHAIESE